MTKEHSLNFIFEESKLSEKPISLYLNGKEVGTVRKEVNEVIIKINDRKVEKWIAKMREEK